MTAPRESGAHRIFQYNRPTYLATWAAGAAIAAAAVTVPGAPLGLRAFGLVGAAAGVGWSLLSLAVSWYVYDRSALASGAWIAPYLPAAPGAWGTLHAGLDAEVDVAHALAATGERWACAARVDIYQPTGMTASIDRARALEGSEGAAVVRGSARALPFVDGQLALLVVAFTAHELRVPADREALFQELARVVAPAGRVLLVEHLRDGANFTAFGPGFTHFFPRREWLRLAASAGLTVAKEGRVTPFVAAFSLARGGSP